MSTPILMAVVVPLVTPLAYRVKAGITISLSLLIFGGWTGVPGASASQQDAAHIRVDGPDGSYVEVVLLSAEAAYRPTASITGPDRGFCVDTVSVYYGPHKIENVPFANQLNAGPSSCSDWDGGCSGDDDGYGPNGQPTIEACIEHDHWQGVTKEPVTSLVDGSIPVFLEGEGCIKIYHPEAGEPIIIGSEELFISGPLEAGGNCEE